MSTFNYNCILVKSAAFKGRSHYLITPSLGFTIGNNMKMPSQHFVPTTLKEVTVLLLMTIIGEAILENRNKNVTNFTSY